VAKIVLLTQRTPWPPDRGDKITTWRLLERMARRHEVHSLSFAHGEDDERAAGTLRSKGLRATTIPWRKGPQLLRAAALLATTRPITLGVYGSGRMRRAVDAALADADLAYAYSSSMAAFLLHHHQVKRVMHFAELDSDKWRQYAQRVAPPAKWVWAREARTLLRFERRVAAEFDASILCTPLEQEVFARHIPDVPSRVLRNGVDLEYFAPRRDLRRAGELVFTGVMDYEPNVDGVEWFVREILPLVRLRVPGARFSIVGSKPVPRVQALAAVEGVVVTGRVEDVRVHLHRAAVSVAPLRIARGIQNKVLEAMAAGVAVVGTTSATQGVECQPGRDLVVRDDPREFAAEVARLLEDSRAAEELGARGRALVEARYDWERTLAPLDAWIDEWLAAPSRP
jgi:sugar transferase (PEP-CTERM/EpsH1 system associated)